MMKEIEGRGGFLNCIQNGWLRRLLELQCIKWRQGVDSGKRTMVGLNAFKTEEEVEVPPFTLNLEEIEARAIDRVRRWKADRDNPKVKDSLERVKGVMQEYDRIEKAGGLMPALLEAARAKATLGEIMGAIVEVSGGYVYSSRYGG